MTGASGMKIVVAVNGARNHLVVQLEEHGKALGHITLEAPEADIVISGMAESRAALLDQVSPELDPTFTIRAIEEPAWRVSDPLPDGRRVLALRHPGFGWVGFVMGPERAEAIATGLKG